MHTLSIELEDNVLEKFQNFLKTLPEQSVNIIDDVEEKILNERKREISNIIHNIDNGKEKMYDMEESFEKIIDSIKK